MAAVVEAPPDDATRAITGCRDCFLSQQRKKRGAKTTKKKKKKKNEERREDETERKKELKTSREPTSFLSMNLIDARQLHQLPFFFLYVHTPLPWF